MVKLHNGFFSVILIVFCFQNHMLAQDSVLSDGQPNNTDFSASLKNDFLVLENSNICRTYNWNKGNIITVSISDKVSGRVWRMDTDKPDLSFPGQTDKAEKAVFSVKVIPETEIAPQHLEAEIKYSLDKLEVKRVFKLYSNCPVIACELYFRGGGGGGGGGGGES